MTRTNTDDLVQHVKDHALAHYADGGWDVIVECWGDEEIRDEIGDARTPAGAIARLEDVVSVYADRERDGENSRF